jgi:hypothetical protein
MKYVSIRLRALVDAKKKKRKNERNKREAKEGEMYTNHIKDNGNKYFYFIYFKWCCQCWAYRCDAREGGFESVVYRESIERCARHLHDLIISNSIFFK